MKNDGIKIFFFISNSDIYFWLNSAIQHNYTWWWYSLIGNGISHHCYNFVYILMMPLPQRLFIQFLSAAIIAVILLKAASERCSPDHFAITNTEFHWEQRQDLYYSRISYIPSVVFTLNYVLSEKISVGSGQFGKSFTLKGWSWHLQKI